MTISSEDEADRAEAAIRAGRLVVDDFGTKESKRQPNPPFRPARSSRRLRAAAASRRAARAHSAGALRGRRNSGPRPYGAHHLHAHRQPAACARGARSFALVIRESFGEEYLPASPNEYTPKGKAQDAHEAIRATDASLTPESVTPYLTPEQYKLYELIWSRFIASQMKDAVVARTNLVCSSAGYQMKQSGVVVTFDGWGRVYPLGIKDVTIEPAVKGETLNIDAIEKEQKFTQPQPQYTEAGLVKALEKRA